MKALFIATLIVLLSNCTMYSVKKETDSVGNVLSTEVKIRSTRDLEQPEVLYEREGNNATFEFKAASVDNNTEAMLGLFSGVMQSMMQMMQSMMSVPQPLPPQPDNQ